MAGPLFSDPGVALATLMHTLGAIGYLGGIAFFVGWSRSVQNGHDNPTVLATGASLTYVSILMNLLGGFLRTYQPGHPAVGQFGASSWVTLMVVKHVALFAGMAAAVYLFELHAPRLRRAMASGGLAPRATRNGRAMLATVTSSIVVAAVLGGVTTVLDLGAPPADEEGITIPERPEPVVHHREGTLSGSQPETGRFEVPEFTSRIRAVLSIQPPGPIDTNQYTLALRDPTGATTQDTTQGQPTDARLIELEVAAPAAGSWEYTLTSQTAVAAQYELDIEVIGSMVLEETVTLPAGRAFEINVQAEEDVVLHWDWEASTHVSWNIHTHAGGFSEVVQVHADRDAGEYTTQTAGVHSYMWQADQQASLTFRVWGDFQVLSVV